MSKFGLVAFLALWTFVISSPINEEKRKDEMVNLLRELLLVDLEDELRLETSKRFMDFATVTDPVYTAVDDMWYRSKYSYVALTISADHEWEIAGTGTPLPEGSTPSEENMKGIWDDIKSEYLTLQQPSVILFMRGTHGPEWTHPCALIVWIPDNLNLFFRMGWLGSIDPLMEEIRKRTDIVYKTYKWEKEDHINYSSLFVQDD